MKTPHALAAATIIAFSLVCGSLVSRVELRSAAAGDAAPESASAASSPAPEAERARQFKESIAPLLARRCLECHGPKSKKGRLDLSRKDAALAGGENGPALVPGKSDESLLWQYVDADEMPKNGPPLSDREKRLLREWIDAGAIWSIDMIEPPAESDLRADSNWLRRLTVSEYIETVRSAVGVDIERDARRLLPPDLRADGFSNTAYNLNVDLGHVEAYARLAETIVGRMDVPAFAARFSKSRELNEKSLRELISGMGQWLLRGPLDEHEVAAFLSIATTVRKEGGDFDEAVRYVIEAMLQSPRFIYRVEKQRGDGTPRRLDDYELASRLSYILWGGPPDSELMRAAEAGELSDRGRVEAQVRRMLQDPRAVEKSSQFIREWLNLDHLANLRPDEDRFPDWSDELAADMRDETLAFFKHVVWEQNRPLADLMNAQVTFVTPRLADHYGLNRQPAAQAIAAAPSADPRAAPAVQRVTSGLQALYTFDEGRGATVHDTSGAGPPLDLKIENTSAVEWDKGRLTVNAPTLITSAQPPKRLIEAARKSKALTLEAWITPGDTGQSGPARILTLSSGTGQRNFTLGQEGDKYDVRLRTTKTDQNGMPSRSTPRGTARIRPTHVVYTRDATGRARLYIDGEQRAAGNVNGDLSNWDGDFRLALANETTSDRPWRGTFHRIAVYTRALTAEEVRARGPGLSQYDLADVPGRGGLLTQGSVLTIGGDEASMVTRGLFVLHNVLDGTVEDPPPCVDTTPVPTKPGLSQRAVAEARLANQACGGCHATFEPLAFGLEKFNGLGAWHERDEHGNRLREDGEILIPGQDRPVQYRTAAQLMDILAGSDQVRRTITRKVTQFALGRPLTEADAPVLDRIHATAQEGGGTWVSLITAIVMSDLVQTTGTER